MALIIPPADDFLHYGGSLSSPRKLTGAAHAACSGATIDEK